jgi:predicted esterase
VLQIVSSALVPRQTRRLLATLAFAGGASGCLLRAPEVPKQEPRVTGGIAGAVVDVGSIRWQPGLAAHDLSVAGQGTRSVVVWVPEAAEPRALVLLLHGRVPAQKGQPPGARLAHSRLLVSCLAAPALGFLDPIIIAPSSPTGQWWVRSDTELVLGLVLAARRRWPAAGARSVILGYSNGGIGSWYFARLYPEYFRAAIPMAFNDTIVGTSSLPIYAIQGTKDEQFEFPAVQSAIRALHAQGQDVTLDEKYRGSHYAPCSYVPELSRAGHWLVDHVFARGEGPGAR